MNDLVVMRNRQATTNSLVVAEYFKKRHEKVIRDVEDLRLKLDKPKIGFIKFKEMFHEFFYFDNRNRKQTMYEMNRDGFMLLVMGFTGDKALKAKLQFIEAFKNMEEYIKKNELEKLNKANHEWLLSRSNGKLTRRSETDVIDIKIEYARKQGSKSPEKYYIHYSNMANTTVGIGSGQRETVDIKTLNAIALVEDLISRTILEEMEKGTHYKDIFKICKNKCADFMQYIYLGNRIEYAS